MKKGVYGIFKLLNISYKKIMKRNKKEAIIIILIILLCISVGIIIKLLSEINTNKLNEVNKDAIRFKEEFEKYNGVKSSDDNSYNVVDLPTDSPIVYINLKDIDNIIKNEDAYIYISSPTCPYCRATVETLVEVAKELNVEKIYYYDNSNEVVTDEYNEIMEKLQEKNIVSENSQGAKIFGIPLLLKVSNGEIISKVRGVSYKLIENQSVYDELNEEQKKLVYDRYYQLFEI